MRQLLSISSLLLTLLCPTGLAYLFFTWQKHQVKEAVKAKLLAGMDDEELIELKFSKTDAEAQLKWEHSREFEYQGQMYDVVDSAMEGDSIRYRCYQDQAESRLRHNIRRLLAEPLKEDPATAGNTQRLLTFFQSLFCVEWPSLALSEGENRRTGFFYATPFGLLYGPPPAPPPEV